MMKEKNLSPTTNENESELTFISTKVREAKGQDSLLADITASNTFSAHKLWQDSLASALPKNLSSLFSDTSASNAFSAHKLWQDSLASALPKNLSSLFSDTSASNAFSAQKLWQDSLASALPKNLSSLFSDASASNAFSAQKLWQDSLASALPKNLSSLFSDASASNAFSAQKLWQDSLASALPKNLSSLFSDASASNAFSAHKLWQDSLASALPKNLSSLFSDASASNAFSAHKLWQDSLASALPKNLGSLFSDTSASNAFSAQKLWQDTDIARIFRKQGDLFTENYFSTNFAQNLEQLNAFEIQTLQDAAILFSRTPQGAAVIATNLHAVEEKDPDALTKLKIYIEKSPITSTFRKLPLLIQIIIIHFLITMHSIIDDKSKEITIGLMEQAQQYVSKTVSPRTHLEQLTRQLPREIDFSTLKNIRIITGENVRLRNTPSMQGGVLVTLEKYTPVIVIDKSDRQWLYVQLSFEDQKIYGWVNRSYTKAINR